MQLPQYNAGGVQKFASAPTGAAAAAGQAKMREGLAITGAIGDVAEGVQTQANIMLDREEKHEKLSVDMQRANFFKKDADKEYFTSEDIHPDIEVPGGRTKTVMDENGEPTEVPRRIPKAEVYPAMYERYMKGAIATSANNIHSRRRSREFFEAETAAASEEHAELVLKSEAVMLKTYRSEQDAQITAQAEAGNKAAALELANDYPGSDAERAEKVQEVNITIEQNNIKDLKSTQAEDLVDLGNIEYEIEQLRDLDGVSRTMSDKDRLAAADDLENVSYNNLQNIKATKKRDRAKEIGDHELRIRENPANSSVGEINADYAKGGMTNEKRVQLIRLLEAEKVKQTKASQDYNRASWYMLNDTKIAKEDTGVQKGLDKYFTTAVDEGADPHQEAVRIAYQTGYIVEHARFAITGANSGYNSQMKDGLMLYADISRADPNALRYMPKNETDRIKTIMGHMKSGKVPFEQALDIQRKWELQTEAQRALIKSQYEGKDYAEASDSALKKLVGDTDTMQPQGFTEFQPDIPLIMNKEFEIGVRERLPSMGYDLAAAQAAVFEDIKAEWGLVNVPQWGVESGMTSDATYMKFPPEGSADDIKFNLERTYGEGEFLISSDAVSDINHQNGDPITYTVYKVDPDTGMTIRQDARWMPAQTEAEVAQLRAHTAVDKARQSEITSLESGIKRLEASRVRLRDSNMRGLTGNKEAKRRMDDYNEKIADKEKQLEEKMAARKEARLPPKKKEKVEQFDTPPIPILRDGSTVSSQEGDKLPPPIQEIEPEMDDATKLEVSNTNLSALYEARYRLAAAASAGLLSGEEVKAQMDDLDSSIKQTEKDIDRLGKR